ncbi:MAG: RluA family pseudouridine synthase [Alphaproteobacteria bacterium]|nr:RluA family pseudouridine synthase [Alphaproteobacteria bacterium]MBU1514610.1 RluA family pseudouridine synthase [Alphaproteobacteria bacterium]MBU2096758.1 RluA family pseudouridine synthase [Alphaproteobacteria bacterium]MBU2150390.1 RluA family pseudouridine synthase [Alphaproteobacteria bacterium]MBU2306609.1 RluA family pseudouridine synthase [Alphaproteobacteria bacterium]
MTFPPTEPEALDADDADEVFGLRVVTLEAGGRVDKALAAALPEFSRARLQALIAEGRVSRDGAPLTDGSAKAVAGDYRVEIPPPTAALPQPENIPLVVLFEDEHLIVIDKPPGIAMHPAPGSESGTLVNALLHHCGDSLSGIGGVARPGIVHRIDKETSGVVVVAKTDAAHQGLSALFAAHDIDRMYVALTRGAPSPITGTIEGAIGRSTNDRKKMAMVKTGGRHAITHYTVTKTFGPVEKPLAGKVACRLETGRTHQIRVHLASKGSPCLGDPVYGSGSPAQPVKDAIAAVGLKRQALHAAVLGFVHPITGEAVRFESPLPEDMARLEALLGKL